MKEKLIELIQNSVGGCARHWAEIIANHLIKNNVTILREGAITLTRAEREALDKYYTERKKESLEEVFSAIEELLEARYRIEDRWVGLCDQDVERLKFIYGRNVCEKIMIDLKKLKEKFMEGGE